MTHRCTRLLAPWLGCALGLKLGLLTASSAIPPTPKPGASTPLNIVFILADDLGWGELGCYGQQKIPTPHLDRLASQGMRFTQHYSGAPVCAPSRCVLLTGRHLGHAEIRGNLQAQSRFPQFTEGQYPLSDAALTVAEVFHKAGYATGAIGKWGLGPVGSTGDPNRQGFDLFFGYNCQAVAHSFYPPHLWRNQEKILLPSPSIPGHARQPEGPVRMEDWIGPTYAPDLMIAEATRFIARHAHQPFFLYLPFIEPHVAMHPPRDRVESFPANWDDQVYRGENAYLPHPRPRAAYAAMIHDLDRHVGQVLLALDQAGVANHTLVIFTSDNGTTHPGRAGTRFHIGGVDPDFFNSTAGLRGYKGSVYEGGLRVPLIARLPGRIPAGTVNAAPSYFPDWFPTLCEAAGLTPPDNLDGQSLWPTLTQAPTLPPPPRSQPMVWVFPEYGGQVALRLGDFKLVRQQLHSPQPGPWEIYHLIDDPAESRDLAATRPDLIQQAEDILKREVSGNPIFPIPLPTPTATNPSATAPTPSPTARSQPNVLFIAIDDQNDWIGHLGGHPLAHTPHLDRLAERGTTFLNAHTQSPLCNPSRTSLLLSLRPSTTGIYGLAPWFRNLDAFRDRVTLPQHFKAHGYRTLTTGKIFHGGVGSPAQRAVEFDVWGPPGGIGVTPPRKLIGPTPMGNHPLMDWGAFPHRDEEKGDHQVATWAIDQLRLATTNSTPFFLATGFFLPHVPCYASPPWFDLLPDDDSVLPLIQPEERLGLPRFAWYLHWDLPEPRLRWLQENDQWRNLVRSYLACTRFIDAQIGRLLNALDATGLTSNTVVVVWSDHGYHLGEKGISGKNTLWEPSTRVPLILAGPGITPGQRCSQPAELLDLYPTLTELAGLPPRSDLEGISLLPQLRDDATPRARPALTTHNQGNHAVRSEQWRYIRYADGTEELYHLSSDPHEWSNLAHHPHHTSILAQHRRWLPRLDAPPAPGSAHRVLTYDPATDLATWEGRVIRRSDPIPE